MTTGIFRFQCFDIQTSEGVFPVTTDSVLLGAWLNCKDKLNVLDLGTGTGILSLMIAQRTQNDCKIIAVDVHPESVENARTNFAASPWKPKLHCYEVNIEDFLDPGFIPIPSRTFDLIVSNPPYFHSQLRSRDEHSARAKHQSQFDYASLAKVAATFLSYRGSLAVVIPSSLEYKLTSVCVKEGLHLKRLCKVHHHPSSECSLCLCEYVKTSERTKVSALVLHDAYNQKTADYEALTRDYYVNPFR